MNRLAGIVVVIVMVMVGLAAYWCLNPQHMPRFISTSAPGFQVPEPKSPMTNFRPPSF